MSDDRRRRHVTRVDAPEAIIFRYEKPDVSSGKRIVALARTDIGSVKVQVLEEGGENNLHSHNHRDGFWFVLAGRVRFYTTGDVLFAELGKNEGIATPRGFPYWFEAVPSDETLELLQIGANEVPTTAEADRNDRNDLQPPRN